MTGGDDIEAFADDLETADKIIKRAENGVKPDRLFAASEIMPFLRAYVVMRNTAQAAGEFMEALKAREEDSMKVHDRT